MFCRLYDTRKKYYIPVDETMDYLIHPVGTVLWEGAETSHILKELSTQHEDKNGKEVFLNDLVKWQDKAYKISFFPDWGCFGLGDGVDPLGHYGSSTPYSPYTWRSFRKQLEVVGTIHDEEMEAE